MKLKTFFEKFDQFADSPDAVAKMRELVLELAVQGKLVDRKKGDGNAAQLLAEISSEREARAALLRTPKEPASDENNEHAFQIPPTWIWTQLGNIALQIQYGYTASADHSSTEVRMLRITDIQNNRVNWPTVPGCQITKAEAEKYLLIPNDILIARTGGTIGKSFIIPDAPVRSVFASYLIRVTPPNAMEARFLKIFLETPLYWKQLQAMSAGTGQPNVNGQALGRLELPLPPLAEQKRIVAKVDELMALCDRLEAQQQERDEQASTLARASLARFAEAPTPANLNLLFHKSYSISPAELRKAILTLAVQGKLVTRCPLPPPSDELKVAKRKLSEKEGIRNRAEVVRLDRAEWGHPIPKHWNLPNFDDLLVIVSGVTKGRVLAGRKTETVPYLRVANVQRGYLDLNVMKEIEVLPEDENRYRLETGDVLMTEGGDWDKVGRAAVWRSEIERCIHQNHVYRIRSPRKELLLPEWVECYVNSPVGRSFFEAASKQTTNLASINMTQLRGCPLPLPPSEEQRRIVSKVDQLMALVDQLETQLAASRAAAKNLLDAVVVELTSEP